LGIHAKLIPGKFFSGKFIPGEYVPGVEPESKCDSSEEFV
jgi:hypothetical protein